MLQNIEKIIERLIIQSRLIILVAVVFGLISAIVMVILGSYSVINGLIKGVQIFFDYAHYEQLENDIVKNIITAVDTYLIATVLLIFSFGLYELFISKISMDETRSSGILVIKDLDQLKENLAKVIIIVLVVTYFKFALEMVYPKAVDLLSLAAGIFLVALSVFFIRQKEKPMK